MDTHSVGVPGSLPPSKKMERCCVLVFLSFTPLQLHYKEGIAIHFISLTEKETLHLHNIPKTTLCLKWKTLTLGGLAGGFDPTG